MNKKNVKSIIIAILFAVLVPTVVYAQDTASGVSAGNFFEAGDNAKVKDTKARDIFSAGSHAKVLDSKSKGNVFAAGNSVEVKDTEVGADIFAAGQTVNIDGDTVVGNIFAAGQTLEISNAKIGGMYAAGESVLCSDFESEDAYIAGGTVEIDGIVNGDIDIAADKVIIGDNAVITGTLTVESASEPVISESARVEHYNYNKVEKREASSAKEVSVVKKILGKIATRAYWIPAAALIALAFIFLFGKNLDEAHELAVSQPFKLIATGAIAWIAIPAASIIIMITLIGAPLGGLLLMAYILMILSGLVFAGASLGRLVFGEINPILASILGVAIVEALRIIPVAGPIIGIIADMYLIGYVCLKIYEGMPKKSGEKIETAVDVIATDVIATDVVTTEQIQE